MPAGLVSVSAFVICSSASVIRCFGDINGYSSRQNESSSNHYFPRLRRYYEPLRHPSRPGLSLTSRRLIQTAITAGTSRVACGPPCLHAVANTPAGLMETCSLIRFHQLRSSPKPGRGSAPALVVSRPAQRSLTLRPACLPSRFNDLEASAVSLPPLLL